MKFLTLSLLSVLLSAYAFAGNECSREAERKGCYTKSHTRCYPKTGDCRTSTWCACPTMLMTDEFLGLNGSSSNVSEDRETNEDIFEYVE